MAEVNENRDENSGQRDANNDGNRQDTGGETSAHSESSGWVSDARGLFGYSRLHTAASNGQAAVTVIYVSPGNVFPAHISLGMRVSPHTYH